MTLEKRTKLVLKIAPSEWINESRDKRELGVVKELGAEVLVMAKGRKSGVVDQVDGFDVYRMSTRPLGTYVPPAFNRIVSIFTWAHQVRKIGPQIISGHDLPALLIGYLSGIFISRKRKPKLVYDSHEFELGRNVKRSRAALLVILHLERFLMKRCAFSIMVNDSIADEVRRIHHLKQRPVVVRSIPENWEIDDRVCQEIRQKLLYAAESPGRAILLMYHGMICSGRGIENLIRAAALCKDVMLVILGNAENESYLETLQKMPACIRAGRRILFYPAVPAEQLWKYIGAADISMMPILPVTKSYYYALPNKFFESIQALTPVIASDLPEMKNLIERYGIGFTCRPGSVRDICRCIRCMCSDRTVYASYKENVRRAKEELNWENEKERLKKAYYKIIKP